nr:MAG: ORF3 [Giant panda anellovirus]USZ80608.1 ORF3 [Tick-associated anellovirus 9]
MNPSLEQEESLMTRDGTLNPVTSERMASSSRRSTEDLQQHLLAKLDSLIIQEKRRAARKRTRKSVPYHLKRAKKMIQVPRIPDEPEGEWTEGELKSSSDSDIY